MLKWLKFIGLIFLVMVLNGFTMGLIINQDYIPASGRWSIALFYLFITFLIIRLMWKSYQKKVSDKIKKLGYGWKDFGIALLLMLSLFFINMVLHFIIRKTTGQETTVNQATIASLFNNISKVSPIFFIGLNISLVVTGPIMEELVFRGFFSQYFFKDNQKWLKLLVSSSIFGLLHTFNPMEFFVYFFLGMIFYLAYARRGNIVDSISVHIINNSISTILILVAHLLGS